MNNKSFKSGIKDYYQQKELPAQLMSKLIAMDGTPREASNAPVQLHDRRKATPIAFAVAAALIFGLTGVIWLQFGATAVTKERVAEEVFTNHQKGGDVLVASSSWEEVNDSLDKLDFAVGAPQRFSGNEWQLAGGKYCSVGGEKAAQIKLANSKGQTATLYQAKIQDSLQPLANVKAYSALIDSVQITLWQEAGVLFVLAAPQK